MRFFTATFTSLFLIGSLVAAAGSAAACGNGKLILEDKFETLDPAWGFSKDDPDRSNGPNGLVYTLKPNDGVFLMNQSELLDNYEVCAVFTTKIPADKADAYIAVVFWAADRDNYYALTVYPGWGSYKVFRIQKGKYLEPVAVNPDDAAHRGIDVTNELDVVVKGTKATLSLNGRKVREFVGRPPEGGSLYGVNFYAHENDKAPTTFTVRSVQVREIEAEPKRSEAGQ